MVGDKPALHAYALATGRQIGEFTSAHPLSWSDAGSLLVDRPRRSQDGRADLEGDRPASGVEVPRLAVRQRSDDTDRWELDLAQFD